MKKFNKSYNTSTTYVKIVNGGDWHKVLTIYNDRRLIMLVELDGSFQMGHIIQYTNVDNPTTAKFKYIATSLYNIHIQSTPRTL